MLSSSNIDWSSSRLLPSPAEVWTSLPSEPAQQEFHAAARETIARILEGSDPRFLLIVGPCSIHKPEDALKYARKLKQLANRVSDSIYIVMRAYFEKPRSTIGWKGLLYDPQLDGSHNIESGIMEVRKLLLDITDIGIPTGTEFLDPSIPSYLGDLISWGCIGARTAASQIHRQMASGLTIPIGFKNGTDGNIDVAVKGAFAARHPHTFPAMNPEGSMAIVRTQGNAHTHIVLRGGDQGTNFDEASIGEAVQRLHKMHLPTNLLVDCSHDNCRKNHYQQIAVFQSVISQIANGNSHIVGALLESNILAGSQNFIPDRSRLVEGLSVTDPCLDWKTTEELVLAANEQLNPFPQPGKVYSSVVCR